MVWKFLIIGGIHMDNYIENILKSDNRKDKLFRYIFGSEEHKDWVLSLYNAINNTDYTNAEDLTITTINDVIYLSMKNDLSFLFADTMNFIEHQSTENNNLPLRMLFYMAGVYARYLKDTRQIRNLYNVKAVSLPAPCFVVFYNGRKEMPERQTLKLSDSFMNKSDIRAELVVEIINLNSGNNRNLFKKSRPLKDYSQFIRDLQSLLSEGYNVEEAVQKALGKMPEDSEIKQLLTSDNTRVTQMILEEVSFEDILEARREEAVQDGREEGLKQGKEEGLKQGKEEGLKQGIEQGRFSVAKTMLAKNLDINLIAECTGLAVEQVSALKQ